MNNPSNYKQNKYNSNRPFQRQNNTFIPTQENIYRNSNQQPKAKQTNKFQQEYSSFNYNYTKIDETTKCNYQQSSQMNEQTYKSQSSYKKIFSNFKQNEQNQQQKKFTYSSSQYQPQTKIKDWLNLDISNDLNAYCQNQQYFGKTQQENIQYDYVQGINFSQIKDKGNQIFKEIISKCENQKVPINQIKTQLQQAMTYYEAAWIKSQLRLEQASIKKNIATINFKLLLYNCEPLNQVEYFKIGISTMKEAIAFAQKDYKKNNDWYNQLYWLKNQALKEILNTILNQQSDIKIEQSKIISDLKKFAKEISLEIDQDSFLIIQKQLFSIQEEFIQDCKQSEDFAQAENLQENLNLDLKQLFEESQKSSNERIRFFYNQRYQKLNESLLEYQAFKYLQLGNRIYQKEQDNKIIDSSFKLINSQAIWDAVDAYKAAIKLFEGKFLHIEAESYFMLGQIYLELFGHDCQKVHDYIRNSISLDFNSTKINRKQWYNVAMHTMKILQSKSVEKDSEMFDTWVSKNQTIIQEINENYTKGIDAFARWITQNYLPSSKNNFKLETADFQNSKKLLHKVMMLYHADKISGETQRFKFISKQIMIHLTTFYEQVKG
ncbi:hypothetical protein ABPG74_019372 [Tetrahymena malaccensis]